MLVDRWTDRDPGADSWVLVEACVPSAWSAHAPGRQDVHPRRPVLPVADGFGLPGGCTALLGSF